MFEDLKNMLFKETLQVNFFRGVAAGFVWMIVMLIAQPPDMPVAMIFSYPIIVPIALVTIIPILWGIFKMFISMGIPFMGLGHLLIALFIVPGDPIIFLLHKAAPQLVPIETYPFMTWHPYIFVIKPVAR